MATGTRVKRHPVELKKRAIELANKIGSSKAAKELGLKIGTVSAWQTMDKKKQAQVNEETLAKETSAPEKPAEPPKDALVEQGYRPSSRVAKVYTPSERVRALELVEKFGVTKTHKMLGISRFTLYDWTRRARMEAAGELVSDMFTGSDEDPKIQRDLRILEEWKSHPGLGPSQIRNQLRRNGLKTSVSTIRIVMMENGYLPPKVKRKNVHDRRFESIRPNHLWHLDFFHRYINKRKIFVLLIVDDHSRFIAGYAISDAERVDVVMNAFEQAANRFGRPETMMSDGGSAFYAWRGIGRFTRLLEEMGINQLVAKVPQINGKLEVLNGNVQKELFNQEKFFDLAQTELRLRAWIDFYNFRRTHHALGGLLVPADRYFGRADEVLAQIENGGSPEGICEPAAVSERFLDLFRITSHQGNVVVTLMGNQLWPPATK